VVGCVFVLDAQGPCHDAIVTGSNLSVFEKGDPAFFPIAYLPIIPPRKAATPVNLSPYQLVTTTLRRGAAGTS